MSFFWIPPLALAWLVGVACQLQQAELWPQWVYVSGGLVCSVMLTSLWWRRPEGATAIRWWQWLVLGWGLSFSLTGARAAWQLELALAPQWEGASARVVGVVASMPQIGEGGWRMRFVVESAQRLDAISSEAGDASASFPDQLWLSWPSAPPVRVGDRWQLTVRLKAPHGHANPHGRDAELWFWEQGVQAVASVRQGGGRPPPQWLASTGAYRMEHWRQLTRDAILRRIPDRAAAGVVAALMVGDQSAIQSVDWEVFRITGVAHLMAISGLHITGLAWLVTALLHWGLRRIRWRRRPLAGDCHLQPLAYWGGWWAALGYSLFCGWGVPAQRTVCMLGVALLLRGTGRQWPWPRSWAVVCAAVLAWDPWALMQAGFWLSFVAVGVLFAGGDSTPAPRIESRLLAHGQRLWREQWRMSVGLAPLSLLLFQQVSVVGLLTNLVAVPWVTLVVTPLSLLGLLHPWAWDGAAWAAQAMLPALSSLAAWPWAAWAMPAVPLWVGVAGMLGGLTWLLPWPWWMRCLGVVWLLPLLTWRVPQPDVGEFELLAVDIGQGNAVLVRTRHHALLYDTGPAYDASDTANAGQRLLVPLLRALDVRLDGLVISHQDNDHSGGASAILATQPQAKVWASMPHGHPLRRQHVMTPCRQGQAWAWDGVRFAILHPREAEVGEGNASNAQSCVLRIESAKGVVALLVGDIEAAQERSLIAQGLSAQGRSLLAAHWLLVPHHGSRSSSSEAFIQAVAPKVAMVQAGYLNRWGHPRPEVVARYEAQGVRLMQTVSCGAARWRSEAPEQVACEREARRRYWHHRVTQADGLAE